MSSPGTATNDVPAGWALATVGDIAHYVNGLAFKPSDWEPKGRPIIRIQNLTGQSEKFNLTTRKVGEQYLVQPGTVLVSWSATLDVFVWHGPEAVLNQHIFKVVPASAMPDQSFVRWALKNAIDEMWRGEHTHGTTMRHINRGPFLAHRLALPPANEQSRIAEAIDSHLSRLDAAVASLERAQAKLKAYRASVLKAATEGRLVPTEASLARAEKREYEPAEVLLTGILSERRRRWEDAELSRLKATGKTPKDDKWKAKYEEPLVPEINGLPALPEGWCWTCLGQAFTVTVGATPSRSIPEYWNGGIPWVSSGEVAFCRIRATEETISSAGLQNSSTKLNPKGSVLLGMIGEGKTRGQTAILDIDACGNQNAAAIWVSQTDVPSEYVYHYLSGQYETTRRRSSGNNQPALNKARVERIPLPLPPLREQHRIVELLESELSTVANAEATIQRELKRIGLLRQAVLRWAFEGKLVDQDPNEEPAAQLLSRIRAERIAAVPAEKAAGRRRRGAA